MLMRELMLEFNLVNSCVLDLHERRLETLAWLGRDAWFNDSAEADMTESDLLPLLLRVCQNK